MTTPPTRPRARHLGVLGVAIYTLLSPSGKIISSAAAATLLVGGLVTQLRPPAPPAAQAPAPTPVMPARLAHNGSSALVFTYIDVDGQALPVVLSDNPTDNSSAGRGLASASPPLDLSGGGGRGPGAGSPHYSPRHGSPVLPGPGPGGHPPEASQPDSNPTPPPTTGHIPPLPHTPDERLNCTPDPASAPDSEPPNALPPDVRPCPAYLAGSGDPADKDSSQNSSGAGSLPPQDEPGNASHQPVSGNIPASLSKAPGSQPPTGMDDPLNPLIPLSTQPDPLLAAPYDGQSAPQIAGVSPAAVPEPSVIGLMLLGLAALGWTGRRRLTPTRRA